MAVYTEVGDAELEAFLADYDIGEAEAFKGIAEGVENSNFLLTTTRGQYIVTLYEKRVDPKDLPFFLGLMGHLAARGINCPQPIHGRDGKALRQLAGKPAAVTSFLHGMWPRRIAVKHCGPVGEALARLHLAGRDFELKRPNALSVADWRPLFEASRADADSVAEGLVRELDAELAFLEAEWPRDLPSGVIHADLFNDNVFFLHDRLSGLIDFYFACNDALAYDVAICLNAWCFEPDRSFNTTKARALLQAYEKVRPLESAERQALPRLARGASLRFLLTRLYDWIHTPATALVKRKDPLEYLAYLRFHRSASSLASYGL
ncbi:homoserine kinase [Enhydrobacter aerosaccus]|uniref:Homoserine kinase n=1 Tax=Enhydrobacter aerosaccus TaxID=225324 RepID=A0A1T4NSR9_9HYPH|nr:homoserine kinase [Enhydrobacter aerosaccus]SJZ81748.1 homoserine kinase [Enhydrobacter aerosaccus]